MGELVDNLIDMDIDDVDVDVDVDLRGEMLRYDISSLLLRHSVFYVGFTLTMFRVYSCVRALLIMW